MEQDKEYTMQRISKRSLGRLKQIADKELRTVPAQLEKLIDEAYDTKFAKELLNLIKGKE